MATVTQGVLLRLLQSMHTDDRVAGDHRSPILQVTAVVPALTASTSDSPLLALPPTANGVLLNLSDGLHCTYVQVPPADADALLAAARPCLVGHLVHLDRLRFARPVPRAVGIRAVPSSASARGTRLECVVGKPEPLVARPAACARGYVVQPAASPADAAPPLMPSSNSAAACPDANETAAVKRTVLGPKNAVAEPRAPQQQPVKRRFSSPAPPSSKHQRDPSRASSPSVGKTASRATSPAPSKCVVPSLVAASREENRRAVAREPAIIVPSRYRQPSPAGGRRAASPAVGGGRRASLSPSSRRLSGEGTGKKKVGVLVAGISKMTDLGSGSAAKPGRKSWDDPTVSLGTAGAGSVMKSKAKVDKDSILRTQEAMSRRLSDATTEQSSNDDSSVDERPKPRKKTDPTSVKAKTTAPKIILHDPKWTDGSILLDALPDKLSKIGKEAFERRDLAATAAASTLQEALVSESVIRNISKFSEICASSKVSNPFPTVDLFLVVYEDTLKWKTIAESVVTNGAEEESFEKSTKHWVGAALATDLEVLKLLNGATGSFSRTRSTNKANPSLVEPPRTSLSKKQTHGVSAKVQQVSPSSPLRCTWSNTESMSETAELAKALWCEMHTWFLTFVDEALDVGFHLFEDRNVASKGKHSSHITMVLSQFKKISDWLDQVGKIAEEERTKEKIEGLKRKIYGFVISHMGSAFESSVSVSSRS